MREGIKMNMGFQKLKERPMSGNSEERIKKFGKLDGNPSKIARRGPSPLIPRSKNFESLDAAKKEPKVKDWLKQRRAVREKYGLNDRKNPNFDWNEVVANDYYNPSKKIEIVKEKAKLIESAA